MEELRHSFFGQKRRYFVFCLQQDLLAQSTRDTSFSTLLRHKIKEHKILKRRKAPHLMVLKKMRKRGNVRLGFFRRKVTW